jgi:hypothetical protein
MNQDVQRVERVIAMAERLIAALETDIAALKSGNTKDLRTIDPEIQRLSALYARDIASLDAGAAKAVPAPMRTRLANATTRIRETLSRHNRLIYRLRNASEGLVKAVAEEVDRRRASLRTYQRAPGGAPRPAGAMLYNRVV